MLAKACYKCKVFVLIKPDSPNNLATLKEFEKAHEGYMILTVDYNEIRGSYTNFSKPEDSKE